MQSETGSEVRIGLLDSEGRTIGGGKQCWYADDSFSEPNPTGENRESYKSSHSKTYMRLSMLLDNLAMIELLTVKFFSTGLWEVMAARFLIPISDLESCVPNGLVTRIHHHL